MKKLVLIMAVLIAVPAMADVTFDYEVNGSQVTISYTTTDGDLPRGIALKLTGDGVTIESADSWATSDEFNVFLDYAFDNSETYGVGDGHPIADPADAGVATLPLGEVSVCMGYLDENDIDPKGEPGPASCDNVITVTVSGMGTLTVSADTLRGPDSGVVGSALDSNLNLVGPMVIVIDDDPQVCMAQTHPDYTLWDSFGQPDCWCYSMQCKGDIDGKAQFSGAVAVYTDDLNIFLPAFGAPGIDSVPGICADIDHLAQFSGAVRVYTDDLNIFLPNFGAPGVTDCAIDVDGNGSDDFNFWIVPE